MTPETTFALIVAAFFLTWFATVAFVVFVTTYVIVKACRLIFPALPISAYSWTIPATVLTILTIFFATGPLLRWMYRAGLYDVP